MCIYDDGNSVFRGKKTTICNAKFRDLGDNGDRGSKYVVESAIFGIAYPDLLIHYATFMGLQWWLRVVYSWVLPLLSIFGRRWSGSRRPLLPAAGSNFSVHSCKAHYCIGAIDLPASSVKDLAVCWNDCFRKIFWTQTIWICKRTAVFVWGASVWSHNLQRWKFLSSDCVVCDTSVLYKLQAPVVGDLSRKFGVARSVCQMKHFVRLFFYVT